jgi:hypothetical protein
MSDDIKALNAARDALWGDPDDEARPSAEGVASRAATIMMREGCTFIEACHKLVERNAEADALEARAKALRQG